MPIDRRPPDLPALFELLADHDVAYVVTGSTAALLHGIELTPGDLDITPALDARNLARLAEALSAVEAHPNLDGPFGDWQPAPHGEWRWVERDPKPGERDARAAWSPDPADPGSFDTQLETRLGAIDIVPVISGSWDDLIERAARVRAFGQEVFVASIADQLATLTVARRGKDRARVEALRLRQRDGPVPQTPG